MTSAARAPQASGPQAVVPAAQAGVVPATSGSKISVVSTGVSERLAEQRAMRRHRLVRRVVVWTASLALLVGASWLVFASSVLSFDADHLTVSGTGTTVDLASVVEVVSAHEGTPLALLKTGAVRDEVLAVKNIRDVTVTRQWPQGLAVEVEARQPVAAVPVDGGVALLDRDAVTVDTVAEAPEGVPVITIPLTGDDRRTLEAALLVLDSLPDDLTAEVGTVSAATQDAVVLTLRSGVVVEWGSAQDSELKVQVLHALRTADVSKDAQVFDVSAPTFPITR